MRKEKCFEVHQLVAFHSAEGESCSQNAYLLQVDRNTVAKIIQRFNKEDYLKIVKERRGIVKRL